MRMQQARKIQCPHCGSDRIVVVRGELKGAMNVKECKCCLCEEFFLLTQRRRRKK